MRTKSTVSRRALMKTFAGLGMAAPFYGLLRDAFAQTTTPPPPRFVVLNSPHGCAPDMWRPRTASGAAAASGSSGWTLDFDPDASLGPLEKHKDSLLIIEGLDLKCNYDVDGQYLGHNGGAVAPLTGLHARAPEDADSMRTTGPSIDTFLASRLKVAPFLFFPLGYSGSNLMVTFDQSGERVPNEYDLGASFDKWFGAFMPPATAAPDPKIAARSKAETAVLGYLNADAKRLRARLAGTEALKLDGQIDALNLIAQRLAGVDSTPPPAACVKPTRPQSAQDASVVVQSMLTFAAQLLACNLTRVANLSLDPAGSGKMPWISTTLAVHTDIAHAYRPDDPASGRMLSKVQRWYASQVAAFIDLLKAIPEGNGTVYDNTIILWINELGDPARHMNNNLPFVMAGGGGTYKKGRYLQFSVAPEYKDSPDAHNKLLTSIANQYGAGVTTFGDPRYPGELPGFLG
jgi:Protein of unknown function (DUF1552)